MGSTIHIESHEAAAFGLADSGDLLVAGPAKTLGRHGRDVVPGCSQDINTSPAEVLVELEAHQRLTASTATYRSRAISAP